MYRNVFKRFLDFFLAIILLIVTLPVTLIVALLIKLEDGGPVIYIQERTGQNNKDFKMFKFRSMNVMNRDSELTVEQSARITKIGRIIRKTSIDELPQLLNIIKGDMSFIGPRPWVTELEPYYTENQKRRHLVKPGITGLAQTSGRNEIDILDRIEYDLKYVENVNILLDLKIFFMTIFQIFKAFIMLFIHSNEKISNQGDRVDDLYRLMHQEKKIKKNKSRYYEKKVDYKNNENNVADNEIVA